MRRHVPTAVLTLAALALIATVVNAIGTIQFVASAERARGVVVDVEARSSGGSAAEVTYFPVVAFDPPDGPPQRFVGDGSGATEYRIGDAVDVLYLPDPPREPRLRGVAAVWSLTAALLVTTVILFGAAMLLRRVLLEARPEDEDEP